MSNAENVRRPVWQQLAVAGVSTSTASTLTHPIDTCKSRIQLHTATKSHAPPSLPAMAVNIMRNEPASFFSGLSAGLVRNMTYSATRIGLYHPLQDALKNIYLRTDPAAAATSETAANASTPFSVKITASLLSGAIAACVGNPFDLLKVRMQAAPRGGFISATKDVLTGVDGVFGLWRGLSPALVRASLLTSSQLVSYDACKMFLADNIGLREGTTMHVSSGLLSGLITTTVINPVDVVKTRIMNERTNAPSAGFLRVARDAVTEGAMWRGWTANYVRLGPHVLITMVVYEKMRQAVGWSQTK